MLERLVPFFIVASFSNVVNVLAIYRDSGSTSIVSKIDDSDGYHFFFIHKYLTFYNGHETTSCASLSML